MNLLRFMMALLAFVVLVGLGLVGVRYLAAGDVPPGLLNPALEFYTRHHERGYGGIDRWATYGMKAQIAAALLTRNGYGCKPPQALASDATQGTHEMACQKQVGGPMARTLTVHLLLDQAAHGRLVSAHAHSTQAGQAWWGGQTVASLMKALGWIEPEQLQVKGFEIDSVDTLAQVALDALSPTGWHAACDGREGEPHCRDWSQSRRETGLPPLVQAAVQVNDAMFVVPALEKLRFLPVAQRGADEQAADALLVRVDDEYLWLDFTSRDLTGRKLAVSIALDSSGGAPQLLVAQLGWEKAPIQLGNKRSRTDSGAIRFVPLEGKRRLTASGATRYLVPLVGSEPYRHAVWIDTPGSADPHRAVFRTWAKIMPRIDPVFLPRIMQAAIGSITTAFETEEALGLYPALRNIERRAEQLRLAEPAGWMPAGQADASVGQAFRNDPAMRASWWLAHCERKPPPKDYVKGLPRGQSQPMNIVWEGPTDIDAECWRKRLSPDAEVVDLLRREVTALEQGYAELEPSHPLRLRLQVLNKFLFADILPEPPGMAVERNEHEASER